MIIKEMPSYQVLTERAKRYPNMNVRVTEAYLHILRTGTTLHNTAERIMAKMGLSYGRFMILALLSLYEEPVPVCKLADLAGVTTPTVSAVLSGMVRDGYVRRQEDALDRRVVRIEMLPAGQDVLDRVWPVLLDNHCVVMAGLDEEELGTLIGLLCKVNLETGIASDNQRAYKGRNSAKDAATH